MKRHMNLGSLWQSVAHRMAPPQSRPAEASPSTTDIQSQVDIAHREWVAAQQYFQSVSEPALVDHAIYLLEAAERKYMYLLNKLRAEGGKGGEQSPWT